MTRTRWVGLVAGLAIVGATPSAWQQTFVLQPQTHICIIGNTLGERLQHDGWLETMIQARFPKHELVVPQPRRSAATRSDTRLRSKNFGTPDEWLSGLATPIGGYEDNRLAGNEHESGRRLRVLRLQRVVCRTGGSRRVQEEARRLDHAHARAEIQRQVRAASWCCSRRSRTRTSAIPICRTARRTTSGWSSTPGRWRRSRRRMRSRVRRSLHAEPEALRRQQGAADDAGRAPEQRRQPPDRERSSTARCSVRRRSTRSRSLRACARRSSTRTSTGSSAIA